MSFISGTYDSAVYHGQTIGQGEAGFRLRETNHKEDILTDSGGDAPVDGVIRGTEYELTIDYIEYDLIKASGALYTMSPQGQPLANVGNIMVSTIGTPAAHQLVLTAKAGSSAALLDGAGNSWVFHRAALVSDLETLLANKLRKGPVTFKCYPDPSNSNHAYDIITTPTGSGG